MLFPIFGRMSAKPGIRRSPSCPAAERVRPICRLCSPSAPYGQPRVAQPGHPAATSCATPRRLDATPQLASDRRWDDTTPKQVSRPHAAFFHASEITSGATPVLCRTRHCLLARNWSRHTPSLSPQPPQAHPREDGSEQQPEQFEHVFSITDQRRGGLRPDSRPGPWSLRGMRSHPRQAGFSLVCLPWQYSRRRGKAARARPVVSPVRCPLLERHSTRRRCPYADLMTCCTTLLTLSSNVRSDGEAQGDMAYRHIVGSTNWTLEKRTLAGKADPAEAIRVVGPGATLSEHAHHPGRHVTATTSLQHAYPARKPISGTAIWGSAAGGLDHESRAPATGCERCDRRHRRGWPPPSPRSAWHAERIWWRAGYLFSATVARWLPVLVAIRPMVARTCGRVRRRTHAPRLLASLSCCRAGVQVQWRAICGVPRGNSGSLEFAPETAPQTAAVAS
jgi:hypothetical protein